MLKTQTINNINVVSFSNSDRFNSLITEPVKESLMEYFNKSNVNLVLDLDGIKFIDSSGFGVFLSVMKTANNNYGIFKICNVSDDVMELFKLLQLHNVFEIYGNQEDCIKSFA
jgi:anti-sigma B factor antagonist